MILRKINRRELLRTTGMLGASSCLSLRFTRAEAEFPQASPDQSVSNSSWVPTSWVPDQWFDPSERKWPADLQQVLMQGPKATPKDPNYQRIPCYRVVIKGIARACIVRLLDGTLLGSGIGTAPDKSECITMFRSSDGGLTWTFPQPIPNFPTNSRNGYMTVLNDGSLLMMFKTIKPEVEPLFSWSTDGGKTWSVPNRGPENVATAGIGGATFSGLVLPDGELLVAMFIFRSEVDSAVYVWRSRDGGRTFYEKNLIVRGGYNETHLLRLPSGKLLAAIREVNSAYPTDGDDFTAICESLDEGRTWSWPRRITAAWEAPGWLIPVADGRVLMIYGVRHPPQGMSGLVSEDEGLTWRVDHPFLISWTGHNEYTGYPCGIALPDGRVLTACYLDSHPQSARVEIALWRVPPLPAGKF